MLLYTLPNAASFCRAKFLTRRKNCVAGDDTLASSQSFEIPLHCGESFFAPRLTPSQEIKIYKKKETFLFFYSLTKINIRETTCIILLLEHNLHRPCHHFRVYFSFLIFLAAVVCATFLFSFFHLLWWRCFGTDRPTDSHPLSSHFAFADEGGCDQDYKVELCRVFIIFVLEVLFFAASAAAHHLLLFACTFATAAPRCVMLFSKRKSQSSGAFSCSPFSCLVFYVAM